MLRTQITVWHYVIGVVAGIGTSLILSPFLIDLFFKAKVEMARTVDTLDIFKKNTVHVKNPAHVEELISLLVKGGYSKLQVISDFDHTISRVHFNGAMCDTTYGILDSGPYTPEENRIKANLLFQKYYPIEVDPHLTRAEKTLHMVEWYTQSRNLMTTSGIKKGDITAMVRASNALLRDGCDAVFKTLLAHDIPLLIFSAGIGDILKEVLKQRNLLLSNMEIVANFIQFDEQDNIMGFQNRLIHTFNKNQYSLENSDYFDKLKSRKNIILLGDSLGDIDMSEGAQDVDCILKIGFLNKRVEESLPDYLKAYDVVLADDQTMDFVNGLLKFILQNSGNLSSNNS